MINSFFQILLFVSIPIPIALLLRGRSEALLISPLVGLAIAPAAGMLHLIFDVPIVFAWLFLIVGAYIWILRSKSLRRRVIENSREPLEALDYIVIIVGAVCVIGFIWRIPPPLGWDARSIWLFIASWLIEDSQVYVQVQQMPGVLHRGYPFGAPASIAVAWQLYGGVENLWSGVRLIAVLTLCASLLTVKTLLNHVVTGLSNGFQVLVALILTPVLFLVYGGFSRNGSRVFLFWRTGVYITPMEAAVIPILKKARYRLCAATLLLISAIVLKSEVVVLWSYAPSCGAIGSQSCRLLCCRVQRASGRAGVRV